jgi:ATP-dependent protease ClpP protease subunit
MNEFLIGAINTQGFLSFKDRAEKNTDIQLYISSYGGGVNAAFEYANYIEGTKKTDTHILSHADSAATVVFLAGRKRYALRNTTFMIHDPYLNYAGPVDAKDAEKIKHSLEVQKQRLIEYYALKIPFLTRQQISDYMAKETYLTGEQLMEYGALTELRETYDIAAYNKEYINTLNTNTMGLFSRKKETANLVKTAALTDKITVVFENELKQGTETRAIGDVSDYAGTYIVENKSVTIDSEGIVTAISDVKTEPKNEVTELKNELTAVVNTVKDMTTILAEVTKTLTALKTENEELKQKTAEAAALLNDVKNTTNGIQMPTKSIANNTEKRKTHEELRAEYEAERQLAFRAKSLAEANE